MPSDKGYYDGNGRSLSRCVTTSFALKDNTRPSSWMEIKQVKRRERHVSGRAIYVKRTNRVGECWTTVKLHNRPTPAEPTDLLCALHSLYDEVPSLNKSWRQTVCILYGFQHLTAIFGSIRALIGSSRGAPTRVLDDCEASQSSNSGFASAYCTFACRSDDDAISWPMPYRRCGSFQENVIMSAMSVLP